MPFNTQSEIWFYYTHCLFECCKTTKIVVERNASLILFFLTLSSISIRLSSSFCPWPTVCWKGICLGKFWRLTSPTAAVTTWTNSPHNKKNSEVLFSSSSYKLFPPFVFVFCLSFLMFLGGFGAAVIDWNQFNDILFVKGRCLIKYFYIFTHLIFVSKVIN